MQEYVSTPDNELVIIDDIIPREAHIRPGYVVEEKKYIVIHNTGNYGEECDAASHADYLREQSRSSSPREASWHYTVDDKRVYCHIPDNESAWHAGDGTFGEGNYYGISIEICVNGFPLTYEGEEYEQLLAVASPVGDGADDRSDDCNHQRCGRIAEPEEEGALRAVGAI